ELSRTTLREHQAETHLVSKHEWKYSHFADHIVSAIGTLGQDSKLHLNLRPAVDQYAECEECNGSDCDNHNNHATTRDAELMPFSGVNASLGGGHVHPQQRVGYMRRDHVSLWQILLQKSPSGLCEIEI